jgi:FSR family fosmidomycin resistance protein-like MFS transporter
LTDREGKFHTPSVLLVSIAHMVHDTYPAFLAPLLPLLHVKLGLSYTMAGRRADLRTSTHELQKAIV